MIEPTESAVPDDKSAMGDGPSLLTVLLWLLRAKRTIFLTGLVFALCGLGFSFTLPVQYTAQTEILPPQAPQGASSSAMSQMGAASAAAGSLSGFASTMQAKSIADMYSLMIVARPIQDALIQRFDLRTVYHDRMMLQARGDLAGSTEVAALREGFVTLAVTDTDPVRARDMANGYVEQLRVLLKGLASGGASQRRAFYEQQMAAAKFDLSQAEMAFEKMQKTSHMISVDAQSKTLIEGAANLRAQMAAKEVELRGLRTYSTEANPEVEIAEQQLAALHAQQGQLNAESKGSYSDVGLSSVPAAELDYVRASRELRYHEELYEMLSKQYEVAKVDEAQDAPVVEVIEPAILPEKKSSPRRGLIMLGAMVVGFLAGVVRVLYRQWRLGLDTERRGQLAEVRRAAFWSSS
ncbi:MAG: GNVR domain-containing protein [Acidobacteriota bacterium]